MTAGTCRKTGVVVKSMEEQRLLKVNIFFAV